MLISHRTEQENKLLDMPRPLAWTDFIHRAQKVHGYWYSYFKADYVNTHTKIIIICPIHGEFLQSPQHHLEGHRCKKCSLEVMKTTMLKIYGFDHPSHVPKFKAKRNQTFLERFGGHPLQHPDIIKKVKATWAAKSKEEIAEIMVKKVNSFMERYGYENPFLDATIKDRINWLRRQRGEWIEHSTEFETYKYAVLYETERNYSKHKKSIDPFSIRGRKFHLDHIFSIKDGFDNNISPIIIGHFCNLRIIERSENIKKNKCSFISIEELQNRIFTFS